MAAPTVKPHIEVLEKTFSELPDGKGGLQPYTFIVYKDETGAIGSVNIQKKDPTDADIRDAVRKAREAQKARKPYRIEL